MAQTPCTVVPFRKLKTIKLSADGWIFFDVPSQGHSEAVLVHRGTTHLTVARNKAFNFCESWSWSCCTDAPLKLVEDHKQRLYKRSFESGEWVDAGHTRETLTNRTWATCKSIEYQSLVRIAMRSRGYQLIFEPMTEENDVAVAAQIALQKFNRGIIILSGQEGDGLRQLGQPTINKEELCNMRMLREKVEDYVYLREIGDLFAKKGLECPPWASMLSWEWTFLARCIRILQRQRQHPIPHIEGGVYTWQTRATSRMNGIVNKLASRIGARALLFYKSFAATNYKWQEAGENEDNAEDIDERIVEGILASKIEILQNLDVFNPFAFLSLILEESYIGICETLGVRNLSCHHTDSGAGPYQGLSLNIALDSASQGLGHGTVATEDEDGVQGARIFKLSSSQISNN
ncbi:hypothetical protein F4810DRAFT_710462 [Camillea tinctor]|nr:hypothetical protein F4810DRAFT_710462 [Camillea tinctor]